MNILYAIKSKLNQINLMIKCKKSKINQNKGFISFQCVNIYILRKGCVIAIIVFLFCMSSL